MSKLPKLTAENLKETLWETLHELRDGKIQTKDADAVAGQAREIVRATNIQLRVLNQAKANITAKMVQFASE